MSTRWVLEANERVTFAISSFCFITSQELLLCLKYPLQGLGRSSLHAFMPQMGGVFFLGLAFINNAAKNILVLAFYTCNFSWENAEAWVCRIKMLRIVKVSQFFKTVVSLHGAISNVSILVISHVHKYLVVWNFNMNYSDAW